MGFSFFIDKKRIYFAAEVASQQRSFKTGLLSYLVNSWALNVLTAPLIYAGFIPFIVINIFLIRYQMICFPIYDIPKVNRSEYFLFAREDLPCLNIDEKSADSTVHMGMAWLHIIEKLLHVLSNTGVRSSMPAVWRSHHSRYSRYFEFGDAESYLKGLERIRKEFKSDEQK